MTTKYSDFEKKFGLKNLQSFMTPKILDLNMVVLPYYSMLYIFNPNSSNYVSNDHYFIRFAKKKFVFNIYKYNNPPFKARTNGHKESTIYKDIKKKHFDIKLVREKKFHNILMKKPNDIKKTIPVINFNTVHLSYKYNSTILEYYQMFQNAIHTLVNDLIDNSRMYNSNESLHQFVIMEIPDTLYALPILEKYSKYETPTTEMIKLFYDTSRLLLLEFIKLLDDDVSKTSVFYKLIETGVAKNTTIVLTKNDKGIFVNLEKLYSFLKISNIDNNTKLDGHQLQKSFFVMLKTVLLMPGFTPEDIDDNKFSDKLLMGITKDKEDSVIEDIPDEELIKHIEKESSKEEDVVHIEETVQEEVVDPDTVVATSYINKYTTMADDDIDKTDIKRTTLAQLEELKNNKLLPPAKYKKLVETLEEGLNKPSPFKDGKKIKDLIVISKEELKIKEEDKKIPITKTGNPEDAEDTLGAVTKQYMKNVYRKDLIASIGSTSKAGLILKDIKREERDDILGAYEEYTVSLNDMGKSSYDVKVKLPIIDEKGRYTLSGNQYILRKQRADVPIKKIAYNRVGLTSATGKIFIDRAPAKKLDRGFALKKQLKKLVDDGKVKNLVDNSQKLVAVKVPSDYSAYGRYIKSFKYDSFVFSFSYYKRMDLTKEEVKDIEKDKYVLCGTYKDSLLVMDFNNVIYIYKNKKYTEVNTIDGIVGLDTTIIKPEYSLMKIAATYIPVSLVLSYYMGLYGMLKYLKVNYKVLEGGRVRVKDENVIIVRFKFNTLVIDRSSDLNNMILDGFLHNDKILRKVDIDVLNNKQLFKTIFNEIGLSLSATTDIEVYENLFIDPVTETTLETMGEPTTFIKLLIRASEMLLDDFYNHPNSIKGYVMKGYERVPQYVYKTLVDSIRKKKNEEFFGRSRLVVDPYATWRTINEDSAASLVEDINPIAALKQLEDSTYLGTNGRSKDSLNASTRETHIDDIGVISESSKDSGDVGITAYMSANPLLGNIRGMKDTSVDKLKISNILSTSAMLAPFSMLDDPKRSILGY